MHEAIHESMDAHDHMNEHIEDCTKLL